MGFDVTVIERLEQLGGRAQTFHRDGFTFDAGPTVITAPFCSTSSSSYSTATLRITLRSFQSSPWYRYEFNDGSHLNYGGTVEDTLKEIERINPDDVEGYKKLLAHSEKYSTSALVNWPTYPLQILVHAQTSAGSDSTGLLSNGVAIHQTLPQRRKTAQSL